MSRHYEGRGVRRSPYCILSDPADMPRCDLLVRTVPAGPLSLYLADLRPGDDVVFRGPTGRSMIPRHPDRELVLLATGTGVAPVLCLARFLLRSGFPHPISLCESVPPLLATLAKKDYFLVGNGAMLEEMALALSDLGVVQQHISKEPYFDSIHELDRATVAAIRERFVATDLFSAYAARRGSVFEIDSDLEAARSGKAGNGDPPAVFDLFDLLPAFPSHHPDQPDPEPTHVERPWNRPA